MSFCFFFHLKFNPSCVQDYFCLFHIQVEVKLLFDFLVLKKGSLSYLEEDFFQNIRMLPCDLVQVFHFWPHCVFEIDTAGVDNRTTLVRPLLDCPSSSLCLHRLFIYHPNLHLHLSATLQCSISIIIPSSLSITHPLPAVCRSLLPFLLPLLSPSLFPTPIH